MSNLLEFTETQMNAWEAMQADTHRQYGQFSWGLLIKGTIFRRTFRPIVTMRLCQGIATSPGLIRLTLPLFRVLHRIATHNASIDLSWQTEIGGGASSDTWLGSSCESRGSNWEQCYIVPRSYSWPSRPHLSWWWALYWIPSTWRWGLGWATRYHRRWSDNRSR